MRQTVRGDALDGPGLPQECTDASAIGGSPESGGGRSERVESKDGDRRRVGGGFGNAENRSENPEFFPGRPARLRPPAPGAERAQARGSAAG